MIRIIHNEEVLMNLHGNFSLLVNKIIFIYYLFYYLSLSISGSGSLPVYTVSVPLIDGHALRPQIG